MNLFKVFSQTLTLTPLINSSTYSYNSARRRFCCSTAAAATTTTTTTTNTSFARLLEKKLPLLIVPYDHHKGCDGGVLSKKERKLGSSVCDDTLGFISLFHGDDDDELNTKKKKKEEEVYKVYLPEIADRRICGSSEGWLVTVHENTEVQLLNPISRVLVNLPPLITAFPEVVGKLVLEENRGLCYLVNEDISGYFTGYDSHYFRESFFKKVVTNTTTPTTDTDTDVDDANNSTTTTTLLPTTVVMAIYGGYARLAFCRLSTTGNGIDGNGNDDDTDEQNKWICCLQGDRGNYQDVTFYKGNFYAVHCFGSVVVVKGLDGPSPFVESIIEQEKPDFYSTMNYLVESSSSSSSSSDGGGGGGDLLKVRRPIENKEGGEYRTIEFRVLKLDFNGPSWVEVTNLGEDCALFVGHNHSFSFSASKFPGCRGNCIYFTDNNSNLFYEHGGHDMGIYNLEDGSFEKLYETSCSQLIMPPPIWYVPN